MAQVSFSQATWPAAGTTSNAVNLAGTTVTGFFIPSGFSGTAVTFTVCDTVDGTYVPLKDSSGSAISFTVAAGGYYGLKNDQLVAFLGVRHLKVVSGSSESAGTVVKLAVRELQ